MSELRGKNGLAVQDEESAWEREVSHRNRPFYRQQDDMPQPADAELADRRRIVSFCFSLPERKGK